MTRRVGVWASALIITLALISPVVVQPAYAADDTRYTATLRYYDDVQLTYSLVYPNSNIWNGAADIPIGGTQIAGQLYCIDPFVPFHTLADSTYWDRATNATVDEKGDYVSAAPWNMSATLYKNIDAVTWLSVNGYRGDYLSDDAQSKASVARLSALYPALGAIDKQIALMASKVAMWKILVGDSLTVLRTSLGSDFTTGKAKIFADLVDALVASATFEQATGITRLEVELNYDAAGTQLVSDASYQFYGPVTASVTLSDAAGSGYALDLDDVPVTVGGSSADDITLVAADKSPLPGLKTIPGTSNNAQYLDAAAGTISAGVWTSEPFYLQIPASRSHTGDLILKAYAMANNVPLIEGTPVFFINQQADGSQSWNAVQAFIGAANSGAEVNLYAETGLHTSDVDLGQLFIAKQVENSTNTDNTEFTFRVEYTQDPGDGQFVVLNLSDYPVHGAASVNDVSNTFTLTANGLAMFSYLPVGYEYRVVESAAAGYSSEYQLNVAAAGSGSRAAGGTTVGFEMDDDLAMVTFYNTNTAVEQLARAQLYVEKLAVHGADIETGVSYTFVVEQSDDEGVSWSPVNLSAEVFLGDSSWIVDAAAGTFTLGSRKSVLLELDPAFTYRVQERDVSTDVIPMYILSYYADDAKTVNEFDPASQRSNLDDANWTISPYAVSNIELSEAGYARLMFINQRLTMANLTISKTVISTSAATPDDLFSFSVWCLDDGLGLDSYPWAVPLSTSDAPLNDTFIITGIDSSRISTNSDGEPTVFSLKAGESATIYGLFVGTYRVKELNFDGFTVSYTLDSGTSIPASDGVVEIELSADTMLTFTNTEAVNDDGGEEADEGEDKETDNEGDDTNDKDDDSGKKTEDGEDENPFKADTGGTTLPGTSLAIALALALIAFGGLLPLGISLYRPSC
ncbi:MAG: hypothetical protein FWG47_03735 [Propionibacteriaceae bacterium]|nr:hypothetical protein [Propionibacteriaceae bacterium]